jgi:hypothetical protein
LEKARKQKDGWCEKEENKIDLLILYHEGPLSSRLICWKKSFRAVIDRILRSKTADPYRIS